MGTESLNGLLLQHVDGIYILVLIIFLGLALISNVPSILHTPLMSGANAISGVILLGAIISISALPEDNYAGHVLGFIAVVLGTTNVVGGFTVTDRMLKMFKNTK